MKKILLFILFCVILGFGWLAVDHFGKGGRGPASPSKNSGQNQASGFDKKQHSLDDPASIWVIANKHRQLRPQDYAPNDLVAPNIPLRLSAKDDEMLMRKEAAQALENLYKAAKQQGLNLMVSSAYRSYDFQKNLYNRYVNQQGRAVADSQSARPGYSEHQTGLAVDIEPASRKCEVETCFADTPEGKWTAEHAADYGFVIRYQQGKQGITGYIFEPWHLRYLGTVLSKEIKAQGSPTLEEFFGLGPAGDYK